VWKQQCFQDLSREYQAAEDSERYVRSFRVYDHFAKIFHHCMSGSKFNLTLLTIGYTLDYQKADISTRKV